MKWFSLSLNDECLILQFTRRASVWYTNFQEAADNAVQQLRNDYSGPLYLALSGGIDSEFVANTLFRNQISFTPIIVKAENVNPIETWYAEYWCHAHNIRPVIINQTSQQCADAFVKFFRQMKQLKNFGQAQVLTAYDYATQQGGHCIYGAGDINLGPNKQFYCASIDFISDLINIGHHPTSFFMYTPELALSYITQFDLSLDEQYNKLKFYNVTPRPKISYDENFSNLPEVQAVKQKMYYLDQTPKYLPRYHWYGTREQIIQDLQP